MSEIWDAYDSSFHKIENKLLVRGEPIPDGVYHLVGEILVRHTDGSYLLMQRDFAKPHGGLWELSAGGSALKGEDPLTCAFRELKEETGITSGSWSEIGWIVHGHSLYAEFLCVTDCRKDSVVLQKGETIAFRWVSRDELLSLDPNTLSSARAMKLLREQNL